MPNEPQNPGPLPSPERGPESGRAPPPEPHANPLIAMARFGPGEIVRHRLLDFRGVIFDVDPVFANSEEWYESIPEQLRPARDQPFYHLLAENDDSSYVAYVSQQNLLPDGDAGPVNHPGIGQFFDRLDAGKYHLRQNRRN